jgi:NhaP-type Na+/H+ or K+/H+ antiporter
MFELAGIVILGILAQWIAWRFKTPAILPLILIGLLVGPISTLWTEDGQKLLEPIYSGEGQGLFPGEYLFYFVSLAIGVILFEGGLTLNRNEVKSIGPAIFRLILVGSLVTFIGGGVAAHYIIGLDWSISFLFAGLIIVTGPTVIAPILRNLPIKKDVATVLKWEGILIDPLGALVAVLVFEFINSGGDQGFTQTAMAEFLKIILVGTCIGFASAFMIFWMLKRRLVPHYLLNVFTLAFVLLVFVESDWLAHESGLLSVVIMGMVLGNLDVPHLKDILYFKESLSVLLISLLFILLAANIDMADLYLVLNWNTLYLFLVVVFILRPIGVFLSTGKDSLSWREKLFISWVGPRGIVAAGIASLFGLKLAKNGVEGAEYITPLVFMIVLGTVLLNATTARLVAAGLKVLKSVSDGILIVGASGPARIIAQYLHEEGRNVVLIDKNESNVKQCAQMGLQAINADIFTDNLEDNIDLVDMGYLVAMTGSADVNQYAATKYESEFGENGTYRLLTSEEMRNDSIEIPESGLLSYTDDFINLSEVVRDYPHINEIELKDKSQLNDLLEELNTIKESIPILIKQVDGNIEFLPGSLENLEVEEGTKLIYLGKEVELEDEA